MEGIVVLIIILVIGAALYGAGYQAGKREGSRKAYGVGFDRGRRSRSDQTGCMIVIAVVSLIAMAASVALAYLR